MGTYTQAVGYLLGTPFGSPTPLVAEKQKIKMSKMAATAAIFGILIFCFSKTGTKLPGPIGLATSGVQRSIFPTLAGYSLMKMGYRDRWGKVPWHVGRVGKCY